MRRPIRAVTALDDPQWELLEPRLHLHAGHEHAR